MTVPTFSAMIGGTVHRNVPYHSTGVTNMKPFVFKSARESAMVFLEDEKVRLYMLLEVISPVSVTYRLIVQRLHQLEMENGD